MDQIKNTLLYICVKTCSYQVSVSLKCYILFSFILFILTMSYYGTVLSLWIFYIALKTARLFLFLKQITKLTT